MDPLCEGAEKSGIPGETRIAIASFLKRRAELKPQIFHGNRIINKSEGAQLYQSINK